jgi:Predicted transcriptional regulator containing an HTH domain and an uncharacterized domain shared with the mammalian protein Schlafen
MKILTFENVKELTKTLETEIVELKATTGQLERGMESLCAFLNSKGGNVLFGVTNSGKINGQDVSDKTKREIAVAMQQIEPAAIINISYIPVPDNGKFVITFCAEEQRFVRPFTYKGRPYQRIESVTSTMNRETYNKLLLQRDGIRYGWESLINEDLKVEDLDKEEILKTIRLGIENGRLPESTVQTDMLVLLEKLNLSENGYLKNAAAVLFAKKMSNYPQCLLRLARFKGNNKQVFVDNQRVHGNIFKLIDAAMAFFFKHLSLSGTIEGVERDEQLAIPVKALRECCINSLCHRQYNLPGGTVGIAIYDNRVEIENAGTFPPDMNIDNLKSEHRSKPHNPLIADVLYIRKVLESWGRGIGLMIDECHKAGLLEPEFHTDGNFVWVVFHYAGQVTGQVMGQVMGQVTTQSAQQISEKIKILLNSIGYQSLSVKEIMKLMSLNGRNNFLNSYLNPALDEKFITQKYPEQPNHPKQKYYLTEKGKDFLNAL